MEDLNLAVAHLEAAIEKLRNTSEYCYSNEDNYRGDIRYDAMARMFEELQILIHLTIARDYITLALLK